MFTQNYFMRHAHSFLLGSVVVPILAAASAHAAFVINFDENGNGTVTTTAGTVPIPSLGNQTDPVDPTNGLKPLAYNLSAVSGIAGLIPTPGDIDLLEPPAATGVHSDLLRFAPNGWLLIYSDLPDESPAPLADVGFPATGVRQLNNLILPETGPEAGPNGLFGYTPNPGDPGYLPVPPGTPTYNFLSDPAVPEPASLGLLGIGGLGLFARRRRA